MSSTAHSHLLARLSNKQIRTLSTIPVPKKIYFSITGLTDKHLKQRANFSLSGTRSMILSDTIASSIFLFFSSFCHLFISLYVRLLWVLGSLECI
jgi:hypothetical protein